MRKINDFQTTNQQPGSEQRPAHQAVERPAFKTNQIMVQEIVLNKKSLHQTRDKFAEEWKQLKQKGVQKKYKKKKTQINKCFVWKFHSLNGSLVDIFVFKIIGDGDRGIGGEVFNKSQRIKSNSVLLLFPNNSQGRGLQEMPDKMQWKISLKKYENLVWQLTMPYKEHKTNYNSQGSSNNNTMCVPKKMTPPRTSSESTQSAVIRCSDTN